MTKRLLYIDDEVELPHFESRLAVLRDEGKFEVVAYGLGPGLAELERNWQKYDGVLLDVIMEPGDAFSDAETDGGMDTGLRALERLRSRAVSIPVIVITIRRDEDLLPKVRRLGVRDVIVKPIDLTMLVERITEAFED